MKDKDIFEGGLLEYGALMKQGYAYLISNSGKVIAAITAIVTALVTFTNVTFAEPLTASFTSTLCVMLISSYLIYFSLESAGERLGEESKDFKTASARYNEVRAKVTPDMIGALREYCTAYAREELSFRRRGYLCRHGYTEEEYLEYKSGKPTDKRAARIFAKAAKMRQVDLTPTVLLSRKRTAAEGELENPDRTKYLILFLKLLPSTVCMFFTASLVLTAKPDLNVSVVIESILKLASLPIVGFRGYESGYFYVTGSGVLWLETKSRLLEDFLSADRKGIADKACD